MAEKFRLRIYNKLPRCVELKLITQPLHLNIVTVKLMDEIRLTSWDILNSLNAGIFCRINWWSPDFWTINSMSSRWREVASCDSWAQFLVNHGAMGELGIIFTLEFCNQVTTNLIRFCWSGFGWNHSLAKSGISFSRREKTAHVQTFNPCFFFQRQNLKWKRLHQWHVKPWFLEWSTPNLKGDEVVRLVIFGGDVTTGDCLSSFFLRFAFCWWDLFTLYLETSWFLFFRSGYLEARVIFTFATQIPSKSALPTPSLQELTCHRFSGTKNSKRKTRIVLQEKHFFRGKVLVLGGVHPRKLTCPLKLNGWKMYFLLKWSLFGGHVNFQGE